MNNLTAKQIEEINNINTKMQEMDFGDKIQQIISELNDVAVSGTPVNAVNATKTLTISGVVVAGETVTINDPTKVGTDVYEFLAGEARVPTDPTNIPVDITSYTTKSTGTLTMDTQPTAGDTVTIGTVTYTFVPVGTDTADGEVTIGDNLAGAQAALYAAIMGIDNLNIPHPTVSAEPFAANAMVVTALVGGVAGDAIATTETFTAETNVFAAVTLGSGADCTASNAVLALVAAITDSDTQGVGAADGAGDTVVLTADVAGTVGNAIVIGETMTNGAFASGATLLSGGVNGTVGSLGETMVDSSYLYVCVADNTTSGKNWRRISVGSAY